MKHEDHTRRKWLLELIPRFLLMCAFLTLLYGSLRGLNRDRSISQFHHTTWTAREGAPGKIRNIVQTADGYLWLSSATGLYKFDGLAFEKVEPSTDAFASQNLFSLKATPDGGLWVGYWNGGAAFLKDGNLKNYGLVDGLPSRGIRGFTIDRSGAVWAATGAGLFTLAGERWEQRFADDLPDLNVQATFQDSQGRFWVISGNSIFFRKDGDDRFTKIDETVTHAPLIAESPDGSIWIAETPRSVRPIAGNVGDPKSIGPEVVIGSQSMLFDRDGSLWIASLGEGIRRVASPGEHRRKVITRSGKETEIFTRKDGLGSDVVSMVFEDREGNVWAATSDSLERFRESPLVFFQLPDSLQSYALSPSTGGEIWVGGLNGGVAQTDGRRMLRTYKSPFGVNSLFGSVDGSVLIAAKDLIPQRKITRRYGDDIEQFVGPPGLNPVEARTVVTDRSGAIWAWLEPGGLYRLDGKKWTPFANQQEFPKATVTVGNIDLADRKWFGFTGGFVSVIDGGRVETFGPQNGLRTGSVSSICVSSSNIWVSGDLGVALFGSGRFRPLIDREGSLVTGVSGLVVADDGSLWLNAAAGIVRVDAEEIGRFIEDPDYRVSIRVFDALDGLRGAGQQNAPYPTATKSSDGRLWFSTTDGVVWIDPLKIDRAGEQPVAEVKALTAGDQTFRGGHPILPIATRNVRINYTALSLAVPERIKFRYRLVGLHDDWRDAGERREAFYTNLGPGSYRFELVAGNPSGSWADHPSLLEFEILPAFYQTYWFYGSCAVVAVGLVWLAYRWRVRTIETRLTAHFRDRLAERRRIAQDLHDDLLQGFVSASIQMNVVSNLLPEESNAKARLTQIEEQLRNVVEKGRVKVSNLRSAGVADHIYLEESLTESMEEMKGGYVGEIRLITDGQPKYLAPPVHDVLYHISREAIINAIRHARAKIVEVQIVYRKSDLTVVVRDDGVGIDPETVKSGKDGHWGLSMMRERAEEIGAVFHIWTTQSNGTEIDVRVPARLAYKTARNTKTKPA